MIVIERPWGQTKPPVGYGLDWGDPINTGVLLRSLFNVSGVVNPDLSGKHIPFTSRIVTPPLVSTSYGKATRNINSYDEQWLGQNIGDPTNAGFALWMKATGWAGANDILWSNGSTSGDGYSFFWWTTNGKLGILAGGVGGSHFGVDHDTNYHFYVVNKFGNVFYLYIDGAYRGTCTQAYNAVSTAQFQVGNGYSVSTVERDIHQIFARNVPFSAGEIKRLYAEPFAGIQQCKIYIPYAAAAAGGTFNPYFYHQYIAGGMHGESA